MAENNRLPDDMSSGVIRLGLILKEIGNFDLSNFRGRLSLQKTVYLLQVFGINLEYKFRWYLHGTYCPQLTADGFELRPHIDKIPRLAVKFADDGAQRQYDKFLKFIEPHKMNAKMLEIAASICYFHRAENPKTEVLRRVENKKAEFTMDECDLMWNELEKAGVVK